MEIITTLIDFILHIDKHLLQIVHEYAGWTYLVLFLIVFSETGLVIAPFLPGDSVLFALGAIIARPESGLSLVLFWLVLVSAAVLGDFVNYEVGKYFGHKVFKPDAKIFRSAYLERTQAFYLKHGTRTIVYARFVPIVRTFAPFVAGISHMPYRKFGAYNILGGFLWVTLFLLTGYYFGQISFISNNFSLVVLFVILISIAPVLVQAIISKKSKSV
ncbi:DedA family protein [Sphingobacterium sp. SG20118]|uniref:DedA family protein n=1 Tax=Sphingobacterium sp. SG20118 TaxID=3367156 RepID=UPI0037DFC8E2